MAEYTSKMNYVSLRTTQLFEPDGTSHEIDAAQEIAARSHHVRALGSISAHYVRFDGGRDSTTVTADAAESKSQPIDAKPKAIEDYVAFWTPFE